MATISHLSDIGRVGILFGGVSAEREVSLRSGAAVQNALKNLGVEYIAIDVQDNVVAQLTSQKIDLAFIALHGGIGEDGRLQSLLNMLDIPYTGSDTQSSALAMNKLFCKQLWLGIDIPTSPFVSLQQNSDFEKVLGDLGGSVMVKPAHEGSSIGMAIANNVQEFKAAYENAAQYDTAVFAEKLLTGGEYTIAILNGRALPVIKLETDHSFYDYHAKYIDNNTRYLCPCGLPQEQEQQLQELALRSFDSLQCRGWGRVDIMLDDEGCPQVLEVNTVPGMTSHSLVPMAAKADGLEFDELIAEILKTATEFYSR